MLKKDKLSTIEALISKALIHSCISHDKFVSANNAFREQYKMKKEIKNPQTSVEYDIQKQSKPNVSVVKKYTANENSSVKKTTQNRLMLLSNCAVCGKKKSTSIKNK